MKNFLVVISGMSPCECDTMEEAIACQVDYRKAGHSAHIFQHRETVLGNTIIPTPRIADDHEAATFGPIFDGNLKVEKDPHGTDAHAPGAKLDAGKNRLGLVLGAFSDALWEVGNVGTYGANKYTDNGWQSVPNAKARYMDALYRHLLRRQMGEDFDPDTGLLHLAHAAWNALAILTFEVRESDIPF